MPAEVAAAGGRGAMLPGAVPVPVKVWAPPLPPSFPCARPAPSAYQGVGAATAAAAAAAAASLPCLAQVAWTPFEPQFEF